MTTALDAAERHRRELTSAVKRLRVAVTSDPQRADELADALVELTASRLLAWDFTEAAADAPDAVLSAARLLAARGSTGPYAPLRDAVRFFSATAQLAAVQAGLGQTEAAARTLHGLDAWRTQVTQLPLASHLPEPVVVWTLLARARALLADEVASANAFADAAETRLYAAAAPPYLAVATHLLTADCRWLAGDVTSALAHHRLALDAHRDAVAGIDRTARPALRAVALAPVARVYEPYAQRLAASGDASGGIALRRVELAILDALGGTDALPAAREGLAAALAGVGRTVEAAAVGADAVGAAAVGAGDAARATVAPPPDLRIHWEPLPPPESFAPDDPVTAVDRWRRAEQSAVSAGAAARAEAERSEAVQRSQAEVDAFRRGAEAAERARRDADEAAVAEAARRVAEQREAELAAERAVREEAAARAAADERRRLLAAEHSPEVDPEVARRAAAELGSARDAVRDAGDDLAVLAAAHERLADLLRPLAAVDPAHVPEFGATLEALVGLRWQLDDPERSRAAARELRTLANR